MYLDRIRRTWLGAAAFGIASAIVALPHVLGAQGSLPAPVNLRGAVQGSTVSLNWAPGSGTPSAVAYRLEVGSAAGASNLLVTNVAGAGIAAPNTADGLYYIRVRTITASAMSRPSNEIALRVGCVAPPEVPSGLTAPVSGLAVAVSWQPVAGAAGYYLEAGSAPGASNLAVVPTASTTVATQVPAGRYYLRVRAVNKCGASAYSSTVSFQAGGSTPTPTTPTPTTPTPPPPTPGTKPIFGTVDAAVLGSCSAAAHDRWAVDGGDGYLYRTWHPQRDPSGCIYAHEHGDNPARMENAEIAAVPPKFGFIGRRHPQHNEPDGRDEPHEGFKVFVANRGDVNDEGRVNRVYSRSTFHMGTGGPSRFTRQLHSAEIRLIHPEFGLKAFTQLMMDTGGTATVCNPRVSTPTKDVVQLNSPCPLTSAYEIWGTTQVVRYNNKVVYRSFATPAVFDPITVKNPANVAELVYAWDARMASSKVHTDNWSRFRGCDRENYAQPGYWDNARGPTTFYTDPDGNQVAATHPNALQQTISQSSSVGAPATTDGLHQFKKRVNYCEVHSALGLKN